MDQPSPSVTINSSPSLLYRAPQASASVQDTNGPKNSGVAMRRGIKSEIKPLSLLDSSTSPLRSTQRLSRDITPLHIAHGWTSAEWDRWASNMYNALHTDTSKAVLLGMENFGNSCYANSVLQALYYCKPFRDAVMSVDKSPHPSPLPLLQDGLASEKTLASTPVSMNMKDALAALFHSIALASVRLSADASNGRIHSSSMLDTPAILSQNVDAGALKMFLSTLHQNCNLFDSSMHHDAHEFLNFILNQVGENLMDKRKRRSQRAREQSFTPLTPSFSSLTVKDHPTYIHKLFQGVLTNETRCLSCETITNRDEEFLDLSINVEANTSVSSSLRQFSESEMLSGRNKFYCDTCSSLQEAEKRMKIKQPPNILALHLKRFKWDDMRQAYVKHACRVVFPLNMRLFNTTDQATQPDQLYDLFGIVVHIGSGAHQGHYVSIIKIGARWAIFDDEDVTFIPESDIPKYFGDAPEVGSAYVLFYQAIDEPDLFDARVNDSSLELAQSTPTGLSNKRASVSQPISSHHAAPPIVPRNHSHTSCTAPVSGPVPTPVLSQSFVPPPTSVPAITTESASSTAVPNQGPSSTIFYDPTAPIGNLLGTSESSPKPIHVPGHSSFAHADHSSRVSSGIWLPTASSDSAAPAALMASKPAPVEPSQSTGSSHEPTFTIGSMPSPAQSQPSQDRVNEGMSSPTNIPSVTGLPQTQSQAKAPEAVSHRMPSSSSFQGQYETGPKTREQRSKVELNKRSWFGRSVLGRMLS